MVRLEKIVSLSYVDIHQIDSILEGQGPLSKKRAKFVGIILHFMF